MGRRIRKLKSLIWRRGRVKSPKEVKKLIGDQQLASGMMRTTKAPTRKE